MEGAILLASVARQPYAGVAGIAPAEGGSMIRMLIAEPTTHLFTLLCEVLAQEGFMVIAAANNYEGFSSASAALLGAGMSDLWYLVLV